MRACLSLSDVVKLSPAGGLGGISQVVLQKFGRNQSVCSAEVWEESVSLFCRMLGGISQFVRQKVGRNQSVCSAEGPNEQK